MTEFEEALDAYIDHVNKHYSDPIYRIMLSIGFVSGWEAHEGVDTGR